MVLVYHPGYLFGSSFLNRFHPFRFDRARTALGLVRKELGPELDEILRQPSTELQLEDLQHIHDLDYLRGLASSFQVCAVLEVPLLGLCPRRWVRNWFVTPSLIGTSGSLLACREALETGLGFNLSGGFHHAKRGKGEGFCLVSDIAHCVETLRGEGTLAESDTVYYIDLDVHQGNGVSTFYRDDPRVVILDIYNQEIYPRQDRQAIAAVDFGIGLPCGCDDEYYLRAVSEGLEQLFSSPREPALVIYNAGTDIYQEDALGQFEVTREGVNERDQRVLRAVRERNLPLAVLTSGGYSDVSAQLVADFVLSAYRFEKH